MKERIRHITRTAMLAALAIAAAALEGLLPQMAFMPPGAKIGFSNIVSMYAAKKQGIASALTVAVIKSAFVLLTRGFTAFLLSALGGIVSTAVTSLLLTRDAKKIGYIGIGVTGALLHNITQLAVSALLTSFAVIYYLPFLLIAATVSGAMTGSMLYLLISIGGKK